MRRLSIALILSALSLLPAWGQDVSITAVVQKSGLQWEEAIAALLLARVLDLDATFIIQTRKETATPVFVLGPAFVIAKASKRDIKEILSARGKGHGWGLIAHRLGVHPGVFNRSRIALDKLSDDDLIASVWLSVLTRTFPFSQDTLVRLQQQGLSWGDMVTVLQIAAGANTSPEQVLAHWRKERDWAKVREHFGVSPFWLPSPAKTSDLNPPNEKGKGPRGRGRGKASP